MSGYDDEFDDDEFDDEGSDRPEAKEVVPIGRAEKSWSTKTAESSAINPGSLFDDLPSIEPSAEKKTVLVFTLREFESTHGRLDLAITEVIYRCPFYVYDQFAGIELAFDKEEKLDKVDEKIGYEVFNKIWSNSIRKSSRRLHHLFSESINENDSAHKIAATYGFLPGYDLSSAIATTEEHKLRVMRWHEYWA